MKARDIWSVLREPKKYDETPTQEDIDVYNELVLQQRIQQYRNGIQREFDLKASKISSYVQKNVGVYPSDSILNDIFIENIQDINAFESEKDLLHAILISKDPKSKKVQAVSQIIKNYNNPILDFSPITLEEVEFPKPSPTQTIKLKTSRRIAKDVPTSEPVKEAPKHINTPRELPVEDLTKAPKAGFDGYEVSTVEWADTVRNYLAMQYLVSDIPKLYSYINMTHISQFVKRYPQNFQTFFSLCLIHYQEIYGLEPCEISLRLISPHPDHDESLILGKNEEHIKKPFEAYIAVVKSRKDLCPVKFLSPIHNKQFKVNES